MKCVPAASLLVALLISAPAFGQTCTPTMEGVKTLQSARHRLAFRTDPPKITVGKPFAVDLVACPKDASEKIEELRVDAHMPAHRHGMNYKAIVKSSGEPGHYRAEGLMFHMPGQWEFLFDLRDANGVDRLKQEYSLK